jgi:hypothetical protein
LYVENQRWKGKRQERIGKNLRKKELRATAGRRVKSQGRERGEEGEVVYRTDLGKESRESVR